jgi:hypothetical protein
MTPQNPSSFYASLRVEGDTLIAKFEELIDRDIQDEEWLAEARASVEDWLVQHQAQLEVRPGKARLCRGERCFDLSLQDFVVSQEKDAPKSAIDLGPGESLFH